MKTIEIKFTSETPKQAYSIFITDLKQAIISNASDPIQLEVIRQELLEALAITNNLEFNHKRGK